MSLQDVLPCTLRTRLALLIISDEETEGLEDDLDREDVVISQSISDQSLDPVLQPHQREPLHSAYLMLAGS